LEDQKEGEDMRGESGDDMRDRDMRGDDMRGDEMMVVEVNDDGFRLVMKNALSLSASAATTLALL
jgi:hypothetical protein